MTEPKPIGTERDELAHHIFDILYDQAEISIDPCREVADMVLAREQAARVDELDRAEGTWAVSKAKPYMDYKVWVRYCIKRYKELQPPPNQLRKEKT